MDYKFEITAKSKKTKARAGNVYTPHGIINTPAFMPIGTLGTVKAMTMRDVKETGAEVILGNTYHLYLRPGPELIKEAGGLHKFIGWDRPILTDSGGFQVFSLAHMRKITDEGVEFTSHIDGTKHFFSPERVLDIQTTFGSDIMMPLDECVGYPAKKRAAEEAVERTTRWARESKQKADSREQTAGTLFGIVQGSTFKDLRQRSAEEIAALDFPGYAIGGLSVGEPQAEMFEMLDVVTDISARPGPTPSDGGRVRFGYIGGDQAGSGPV